MTGRAPTPETYTEPILGVSRAGRVHHGCVPRLRVGDSTSGAGGGKRGGGHRAEPAGGARRLGRGCRPSVALPLDITTEQQVQRGVAAAVERFGRIDVLVNSAGRGLLGAVEGITES